MKLSRLDIFGIRNLVSTELSGLGQINIFFGANGAGKTSVLEAIHILGLARSFRSAQLQPVVHYEQDGCTVFGEIAYGDQQPSKTLGVKRAKRGGSYRIRIDGQDEKSLVKLAELLPIQLINSTAYSLLESGPKQRRQFMDWGVFHVEQSFYSAWRRMQRSVKQRNSVLRSVAGRAALQQQLTAWNQELIETSSLIDAARTAYFEIFLPEFATMLEQLIELPGLQVSYYRGWDMDKPLEQVLHEVLERDHRRGVTHFGPHRADLKIQVNGIDAGRVLSRGQQKLVICALRLAQCRLLVRITNKKCVLLIDDLPAEIDADHQGKLCSLLDTLGMQLFMTCISPDELIKQPWLSSDGFKLFHVKQGRVEPK